MTTQRTVVDEGEAMESIRYAEAARLFVQSLREAVQAAASATTPEEKAKFESLADSIAWRATYELAPVQHRIESDAVN